VFSLPVENRLNIDMPQAPMIIKINEVRYSDTRDVFDREKGGSFDL
jgi:hypothetical protein